MTAIEKAIAALKHCPLCSGPARYVAKYKNNEPGTDHFGKTKTGGKITCTKCGLSIEKAKNVDIAWNTRAAQGEKVEDLEDYINSVQFDLQEGYQPDIRYVAKILQAAKLQLERQRG